MKVAVAKAKPLFADMKSAIFYSKAAMLSLTLAAFGSDAIAQQASFPNKIGGNIQFTVVKDLEKTPVDDQYRTSTCWSFSSLSFFESEILRIKKEQVNLSEMFVVNHTYRAKAERYIRMHGELAFAPGGAFHDALLVMKNHGMVPQEVYEAKKIDGKKHQHNEMDQVLAAMLKVIKQAPNGKLSPVWKNAVKGVLDAYLGEIPENFTYKGKSYNPKSFQEWLGINPDDYVILTSFTHHPFYQPFVLEVPDNWAQQTCFNIPLEELQKTMNYSITNGYTFAWAADVSEKGFNWKNGVAVVPEVGFDMADKKEIDSLTNHALPQLKITPQLRQEQFDNYETQDDHGMHITGIVKDQNGTIYYKVKNSWGDKSNDCDGYLYASESYVLLKTTNIMLHKQALPKELAKKLGIKQ